MTVIDQDARYARMLRAQQAEQERDRSERQQLWIFVWILAGFKFVSVAVLIFWIEWDQLLYIAGMTSGWWLVVPAIALYGPISKRVRLRRARRKRSALRRAEFEVGPGRRSSAGGSITLLEEPGSSIIVRNDGEHGQDDQTSH